MKKIQKIMTITLIVAISLICQSIVAQNTTRTNVNGVYFDQCYNKTSIVALWGQPTSYKLEVGEIGEAENYKYGKNSFYFLDQENGLKYMLADFDIMDNNFKINGIVGVGDNVSKISELPNPKETNPKHPFFRLSYQP